jgi:hypothetical protein
LPSSLTGISAGGQSSSPASRLAAVGVANPARFISHVPAATSGTPAPASLRPRQIVVFDGGAGAALAQVQAGQDRRRHVTNQPVTAVRPFVPATTAAAASASTAATG